MFIVDYLFKGIIGPNGIINFSKFNIHNSFVFLVLLIGLVVLIIGSITDLKTREVADWVNYGLFFSAIGLRLLYSAITLNPYFILDGLVGFIICTIIGLIMFYSGQWGGGDSKMIIGLGTLFGLNIIHFNIHTITNNLLVSFFINSFIFGAFYGVVWSFILLIKNRKKFLSNWNKLNKEFRIQKKISIIGGLILFIAGIFLKNYRIIFIPLSIISIVTIYLYIYSKSVEKGCMIQNMRIKDLTEGEWIQKDIKINGKYICGPKDLGITKKQIAKLKKLKVKSVAVKIGIPFVPSFLMGFLGTMLFGNLLVLLISYILI